MDLIYMNASMEDVGVIRAYEFDLAYGSDENDFELKVSTENHCCEAGYFVYIEGTEYGGVIDAVASDTAAEEVTYTGRTWHGILNSKVLCPDAGQDYLTVSGNANAVLGMLISRLGLTSLFAASSETSTLSFSGYSLERYITGYDGIRKMLNSVGGKLLMSYENYKVILSAVPIVDYTDDGFDSDILSFAIKKASKKINHLICLGKGELKDRLVLHLYADVNGNISQTQTQTGLDAYSAVYDYSSAEDADKLLAAGTQRLSELQKQDDLTISLAETDDAYDVGDIVGATDNVTGISIAVPISKKIVTIQNGVEAIAYETNIANASASANGGGGSFGGTDTVESQGTTGGWSWRKWSSGISECWCSKEITNMPCSTAAGSWYRTAVIKHGEYPFTFAETPLINMFFETASGTGGLVWSAGMSDVADDKQQAHQFYIIRMAASDGITGKVHTFVRGKYK